MKTVRKEVLLRSMKTMDALYDEEKGLLNGAIVDEPEIWDVRSSAYYALGLLARQGEGDLERADRVINVVLDCQWNAPGEVFDGTFRRCVNEPDPVHGAYPWKEFTPAAHHAAEKALDGIRDEYFRLLEAEGLGLEETLRLEGLFNQTVYRHVPVVWRTYDPNWREFISCAFAAALALFEKRMQPRTRDRLDAAMRRAVDASLARNTSGLYPMNTNIELMHVFISDFYGARYHDENLTGHAQQLAWDVHQRYFENHSFAEFNSPTYCGVDFFALAMWRRYGTGLLQRLGKEMEAGLWQDIADFYHPGMDNICGPFSRSYEMEMSAHTGMQMLLYLALGGEGRDYPKDNCELFYAPALALCEIQMPESLKTNFLAHEADRKVIAHFTELIETGDPAGESNVCTATAWLGEKVMLGALTGAKNHSGQLHPATMYWKHEGNVYSMRLNRRNLGREMERGTNGVCFDATADAGALDVRVLLDTPWAVELVFELKGPGLTAGMFGEKDWSLPGLAVGLKTDLPAPHVIEAGPDTVQVVYLSGAESREREAQFRLTCSETAAV